MKNLSKKLLLAAVIGILIIYLIINYDGLKIQRPTKTVVGNGIGLLIEDRLRCGGIVVEGIFIVEHVIRDIHW